MLVVLVLCALETAHGANVEELPRHPLEVQALHEPQQVLNLLPAALAAAVAANDPREQALLQLARANACRVIADWTCQRDAGQAAALAAGHALDPIIEIRGLIAESRGRIALHDFHLAETALGRAQVLLREHPVAELAADVDLAYSSLSHLLGKHALAAQYADHGLARLVPGHATAMRIRLLRNRGRAEAQLGQHDQAKGSLLQAMDLVEAVADPKLLAEIELELARLAEQAQQPAEQLQRGRRVLEIAAGIDNVQLQGLAQEMIGMAQLRTGEVVAAGSALRVAATAFRQLDQHRDELRVLQLQVRAALAAATPWPEFEPLVQRWLELDAQVAGGERAQAGDDFEAQLRYAEQALHVQQLEAKVALEAAQKAAGQHQERLTLALLMLALLVLGGLAGLFLLQRRAHRRLGASEARYRVLADTTRDLVVRMRPDGERLYVSPSATDLLGWTPEELHLPRWELIHPDDRQQLMEALRALGSTGGSQAITYRTRHRDGHYVWIEALASRIPSLERPGEQEIVYSGRDISARVQAEQALAETQARLRAITDHIPALIALIDTEQRYRFANAVIGQVFGVDPQALIGRTMREARGDQVYSEIQPHVEAVLRGDLVTFEGSAQVAGQVYHYQSNYVPDRRADGSVQGFYALTFDITKLKMVQLELDAVRRSLRTVLDAVPSLIGYWDRQLVNKVANRSFHEWFGLPPGSMPGMHLRDVLGELYAEAMKRVEGALRGESQPFERIVEHPVHGTRHLFGYYLPEIVEGQVQGFFVVIHDVTDLVVGRRRLDAALRENEALLRTIDEQLLYSVTDAEGQIVEVNDNFCRLSGFSRAELLGQDYRLLGSDTHPEAFWQQVWRTVKGGQAWHGEICDRARDGSLRWFDTVIAPFADATGKPGRCVALRFDISARKIAEAELQRLNALLVNILRAATEASIIATDADGLITLFNRGAERLLGYQAADLVGHCSPARFHVVNEVSARAAELSAELGRPIAGFRVFVEKPDLDGSETREWTYVHQDGRHIPVSLVVTTMRDDAGQVVGYLGIAVDITVPRRQRREIESARDQLLMAAAVAELGIWSWNLADDALHWNARMFEIYGQPLELQQTGLRYEHWRSRVHPEDVDAVEASLLAAVEGRGIYEPQFRVQRPDGTERRVQAGAQIERDTSGKALRVTGINRDITAQLALETTLREAKEQADAASAAKSAFLANMSHEIRTPMNAVLGMLHLALLTGLDTRQRDYIGKAQTAARSLLGLLNDVLDFSKIDAGKLQLEQQPFELEALLRELAVVLSGSQGDKDLEVLYTIDPQLPRVVVGDRLRLQQVLVNLASNALKFTTQGHVAIALALQAREGMQARLHFEVSDTGIGISAAQMQRIFQPFVQAEASISRRFGGTGLGLVICKNLIELMGGSLQAESALGRGSRFWFDLPMAVIDDTPLAGNPAAAPTCYRVLVADDHALTADALCHSIAALGWHADWVDGGRQAVEQVQAAQQLGTPYDVVLMDWQMPDMDGIAAAQLIRASGSEHPPPVVIMVTAHDRELLQQHTIGEPKPYVDCLSKPVTPLQLAEAIGQAVGLTCAAPIPPRTGPRLSGLRLLVVEDNALNRQVAAELLAAEGALVTLAAGGLEGVATACDPRNHFDAVLMDVQMPDIDGLEATRRIRADRHAAGLPIVAMTANAAAADRESSLAAGMDGHVGKPIDLDVLVAVLRGTLDRPDPAASAKPVPGDAEVAIEPIAKVLQRFGGNHAALARALATFAPEVERQLDLLDKHLQQADPEAAALVLHTLRGVAGTLGALALAHAAGRHERALRAGENGPGIQVDALRQLAADACTALQAALPDLPEAAVQNSAQPDPAPVVALLDRQAQLEQLRAMLDAGNLDAGLQVDALRAAAPGEPLLVQLANDIDALDFAAARRTVQALLEHPP